MLRSITAFPVTHVLLFDHEPQERVQELTNNARTVSATYREILDENCDDVMKYKYKLIIAFPEKSRIRSICEEQAKELEKAGIYSLSAPIKAEDTMYDGKLGLLSCVLWLMAGPVLLNEVPLSQQWALKLFLQANRFEEANQHLALFKKGWFGHAYNVGLLRGDMSIGHLLRNGRLFLPSPTVTDLLKTMKEGCVGHELRTMK